MVRRRASARGIVERASRLLAERTAPAAANWYSSGPRLRSVSLWLILFRVGCGLFNLPSACLHSAENRETAREPVDQNCLPSAPREGDRFRPRPIFSSVPPSLIGHPARLSELFESSLSFFLLCLACSTEQSGDHPRPFSPPPLLCRRGVMAHSFLTCRGLATFSPSRVDFTFLWHIPRTRASVHL